MSQEESSGSRPTLITRLVAATRYIMTAAVLAVFVGATVLLVEGIIEMARAVLHGLFGSAVAWEGASSLRVAVIEAVDVILVATVLFVIAFGLYQLFVDKALRNSLPPWLQISAIGSLEVRMAGMVITVLGIIALTQALEPRREASERGIGFQIAAVIAALSLFLFQESRHHRSPPKQED
jgi:uncharacterized membrane protein YqhA